jgi:alanine dehydrogenase
VPWTATQALNNSTFPYVAKLANFGLKALEQDKVLQTGINLQGGKITHPAIQEVFSDLA